MLRNTCTGQDKVIRETLLNAALKDNVAANYLYLHACLCITDKRVCTVPEHLKSFDSDFAITTVLRVCLLRGNRDSVSCVPVFLSLYVCV